MKILFAAIMLTLALSCSEDDTSNGISLKEDRAVMLAAAKCGFSTNLPWLRDMIRQAEAEFNFKGEIYAVHYTGGVAFVYQRWISSCLGCLAYDCDGNRLALNANAMNEIIRGTTEDNIIYSSL